MQLQRSEDTNPEVRLRRALHARGLRFRVHRRLLAGARRETDIVFGSTKVAVYVDGCFWHGCPEHYRPPTTNPEYWLPKIERNRSRDRETETLLASSGWLVVRVWEHEDTDAAAERVSRTVLGRRAAAAPSKKATPE